MYFGVIAFAVAAFVLVGAYLATRRSKASAEHPPGEDEADLQRNEDEFAAAEAYQAEWREEEHKHTPDSLY
jgi:hypothetical protein